LRGTTGTNSGSGIRTENIKKKILKPFFTTKRNVMGLGLLISKSMFHAQGGKLNLPQIKNAAAEFHLVLPSNNGGAV